MEEKFDFKDFLLTPKAHTNIESRYKEITPYYYSNYDMWNKKHLPLMTAPMTSVIDLNNHHLFNKNNIIPVLPRTVLYNEHNSLSKQSFVSVSLNVFKRVFGNEDTTYKVKNYPSNILIDIANGHMDSMIKATKIAKQQYPDMKIMVGNIANPQTYKKYKHVDYIRVGIGAGDGCTTTANGAVGYPMASLIKECYEEKQKLGQKNDIDTLPKIVADGGMKGFDDIIKALALGADYVMIGSILNKALESSGQTYFGKFKIPMSWAYKLHNKGFSLKKKYYGMSTKLAQKELGSTELKTSEGIVKYQNVEYTLPQWTENFHHYLISAMSYCGARNLDEFIGQADINFITEKAYSRYNK